MHQSTNKRSEASPPSSPNAQKRLRVDSRNEEEGQSAETSANTRTADSAYDLLTRSYSDLRVNDSDDESNGDSKKKLMQLCEHRVLSSKIRFSFFP